MTPEEKTKCHGSFELARHRFKCTKTHADGEPVRRHRAELQRLLLRAGRAPRHDGPAGEVRRRTWGWARRTGLGLNGEEGGFLPTEEWYRDQKRKNPKAEGFQIGQSVNAVIGQGSTRVTLLQMATLYAAIANGGKLWLPQIVERVESPDGQDAGGVRAARPPRAGGVARDAGDGPAGAGRRRQRVQGDGLQGAPRTTSRSRARPARRRSRAGRAEGGYEAARTPGSSASRRRGGPKIAIAVLVEHGGHGGDVSAPLGDGHHPQLLRDRRAGRQGRAARRPSARGAGRGARRRARPGAAPSLEPARRPPRRRRAGRPRRSAASAAGGHAMNVIKAVGWRKLRFRFDWTLTLSALTVAGLGLVNLWSAVHERQAQPVLAADLVAGPGRGGVPGRRDVRLPQHRAARLRRCTASASRCCWACCCSARWWAAGGAGSTWGRSTCSRPS